jgi:hypothetical protein
MITIHPIELNFWGLVILIINLQMIYDLTKIYYMEQISKILMFSYLESFLLSVLMIILIYIYIDMCPFKICIAIFF